MKIEGGVVKSMMGQFKTAAKAAGTINAGEVKRILKGGLDTLKSDFDGADSESGLAKERDALARTFRSAAKDWDISPAGLKAAKEILGTKLDGKGGSLAKLEHSLRNTIGSTVPEYFG